MVGKRGKSGEEADAVVDRGGFPAAPLLLSGVACAARLRAIVGKVLKGVKALAVSGVAETPGKELELLLDTELDNTDISEEFLPLVI